EPAYAPRRPTDTVLYAIVREHLETFLAHARESYEKHSSPALRPVTNCAAYLRVWCLRPRLRAMPVRRVRRRSARRLLVQAARPSARAAPVVAWPTPPR